MNTIETIMSLENLINYTCFILSIYFLAPLIYKLINKLTFVLIYIILSIITYSTFILKKMIINIIDIIIKLKMLQLFIIWGQIIINNILTMFQNEIIKQQEIIQ